MTIGQKLAGYRKLSGMTQQQLGDYLNISAQAISKWEKDLSEPALATLRMLAELYKVSVDDLLNTEAGFSDISLITAAEEENASSTKENTNVLGFCKNCGIAVTEENVGDTYPKVLCKNCVDDIELEKKIAKEQEERRARECRLAAERYMEENRKRRRAIRRKSLIVAGLITAFIFICYLLNIESFYIGEVPSLLITNYIIFSFIACLFYDCVVQDFAIDWFTKTINFPGLIFSFDLDGFIWYIGMKILFWLVGLFFAIIAGIIGIFLALVCAPFVFPFLMRREAREIKEGIALS